MWACDGRGVDLACSWQGRVHTLRLRYCLDAKLNVRLFGTGAVRGELVRAEVFRDKVVVTPRKFSHFVSKCVDNARPMLRDELRKYLLTFAPEQRRMLDWSFKPRGSSPKN